VLSEASWELAAAQTEAINAYDLAVRQLKNAARESGTKRARIGAQQADVLMSAANLQAGSLEVLEKNQRFISRLGKVWEDMSTADGSDEVRQIGAFLSQPDQLREDVKAKYTEGIQLYETALRGVDRKVRWAGQGQLAAAYIQLYNFTKDQSVRAKAVKVLDEAIKGKEHSPNLNSIIEMRALLVSGEQK